MNPEMETLERAIECVRRERKRVQQEARAFEAFREEVGRTPPSAAEGRATGTADLLEAYREHVLESLDYEAVYGDSCYESIKAELTAGLADVLVETKPLTQQRKRNLLVATNTAIDRRTAFLEALDHEQDSLEKTRTDLLDIEETLLGLPACSLRQHSFEEYVEVWESSEELLERCEQLARTRQLHLQEYGASLGRALGKTHAVNDYLYDDLSARFPALRAITGMRETIERYRDGTSEADDSQRGDGYESAVVNGSSD